MANCDAYNLILGVEFSSQKKGTTMKAESVALANALLEHHRERCITGTEAPDDWTISYGELCRNAGVEHILRPVGSFLQEVAVWCAESGYPPLNSLAVNGESRRPGDSYEVAPNCSLLGWPDEVARCIAYRDYPEQFESAVA